MMRNPDLQDGNFKRVANCTFRICGVLFGGFWGWGTSRKASEKKQSFSVERWQGPDHWGLSEVMRSL